LGDNDGWSFVLAFGLNRARIRDGFVNIPESFSFRPASIYHNKDCHFFTQAEK